MEEGWRGFSRNEYGDFTLQILIFSSRLHSWLVTWVYSYNWAGSKRLGDFDKHVIFNVAAEWQMGNDSQYDIGGLNQWISPR